MDKITISKEIKQEEIVSLEVEDVKNCYLKGNDSLNGITNYLGIWTDKQGLKIVKIENQKTINIDFCSNKNIYVDSDVKQFMKNNNKIEVISKEMFRTELDRITNKLQELKGDKNES